MQQFERFLVSLGLQPREIVPGKWVRCPTETHPRKRNGSYKLADDGQVGWAIDFAAHAEPIMWRADNDEGRVPRVDRGEIARRKAEAERERQRATNAAREHYMRCAPVRGGHEYLESKGLSMVGCHGLKVDTATEALVVPMLVGASVSSLQMIRPDGSKRFWPGARTKGAVYRIERQGAPLTILCEGLATGLTLYGAVPTARVIVAFSSGNLLPAIDSMGPGLCVVAADNDHGTEERRGTNPGVIAAQAAAEALGCGVAVPECQGSDWNDYAAERLAALIEGEQTKRRPRSQADLVRDVNAEIRAAVMRQARLRK